MGFCKGFAEIRKPVKVAKGDFAVFGKPLAKNVKSLPKTANRPFGLCIQRFLRLRKFIDSRKGCAGIRNPVNVANGDFTVFGKPLAKKR